MLVSKTVSMDAEVIVSIEKAIKKGKANTISDFVQKSAINYLNQIEGGSKCQK